MTIEEEDFEIFPFYYKYLIYGYEIVHLPW